MVKRFGSRLDFELRPGAVSIERAFGPDARGRSSQKAIRRVGAADLEFGPVLLSPCPESGRMVQSLRTAT